MNDNVKAAIGLGLLSAAVITSAIVRHKKNKALDKNLELLRKAQNEHVEQLKEAINKEFN